MIPKQAEVKAGAWAQVHLRVDRPEYAKRFQDSLHLCLAAQRLTVQHALEALDGTHQ